MVEFPAPQAQYAFVIHTVNPSTGNEEEVYAELVAGLGEAIVSGMVPGASLSFVGNKADLDNPTVRQTLPGGPLSLRGLGSRVHCRA